MTATRARGEVLLDELRRRLRAAADPKRAAAMQAYMKSELPFHGVPMPALRRECREAFAQVAFADFAAWRDAVLAVWRGAAFREERYAALFLTGLKQARPFQTLEALTLYEELIVTGAWWDLVDEVAAHRLGPLLRAQPRAMGRVLRRWARDDELWKRRAAIIAQVRAGPDADVPLLFDCVVPNLERKELWLRKAIGWALRELARHRPDEVRAFLAEHDAALSGLSKREALKGLARPARPRR